jgi:hypothetical protein
MEAVMRVQRTRRYADEFFSWETVTATLWAVVIAVMLLGATYHRLGRPAVEWSKAAEISAPAGTVRAL